MRSAQLIGNPPRNEAKTKGLLMKNGAEGPLDLDSIRAVNQKVARGTIITTHN